MKASNTFFTQKEIKRLLWIAAGALVYSFFINIFVVPMGMYSGGFMGVSQIIRTLSQRALGISPGSFDYAGIINMCLNVPLFLIASKSISKKYLFRTVFCIVTETIFLTIIPIPLRPIIDDKLAMAIIGGAGCGLGGGIILRNSSSGGGMDLVGAILIKKYQNLSISVISNTVNVFIYSVMFLLFGPQMVIYSVIYSFVYPLVVDRVFAQNINVQVHIITKKDDIEMQREIFKKIGRGITKWGVVGAYTGEEKAMLYVLISKYELPQLVHIVKKHDPDAMIVEEVGVRINGHFEKRIE